MREKEKKSSKGIDILVKKILRQLIKIDFRKKEPLILVNGLAEQYESWFFNVGPLNSNFVVQWPNLYLYATEFFTSQLSKISVDWVVDRLKTYLDQYVMTPPYHLVASSSGGQTVVTYAARYPEMVSRMVLICPSGLGGEENMPMIDGISRRDLFALISSIFYSQKNFVIDEIVQILKERFDDKRWRIGFVRMAQVTKKNNILEYLTKLKCPVLFICGEEDRIVPIWQAYRGVKAMHEQGLNVHMTVIGKSGHAPQIESADLTNKLITEFLKKPANELTLQKEKFLRYDNGIMRPFHLEDAFRKSMETHPEGKQILNGITAAR